MIVGLRQGRKTALRTLVVTFDTAHCSDRNTVYFEDSVHMAASTVEWRVLEDCYVYRFS